MKFNMNIMKQAKQMAEKMERIKAELAQKTVEATSGGGMVNVTVSGAQELIGIKIEKDVVNPEDIEMLQDLITAAINEGLRKSKDMVSDEMSKLTGGLNIPGMNLSGLF
ncbi:MAG: nucleoid-associated protein, YbaB/EbfC family [Candidatus Schekmanbacteria bacterium RBG_13_48_7]|uniref:Nucleoid-associated protein A2161_18690 n=1 Tax=Candidatus Schekmanbacteria bacterium RBG_13_48_7 TaxID=1817878 RepID=A0A1F7RJV4_9BACT|nr:MAG: nucleoid-associated protein, YbaB/EbfC family [Candidatus Schekmanbacteria bacterium RBG_13_48_7]